VGYINKGVGVMTLSQGQKAKTGGSKILGHTMWSRGRGYDGVCLFSAIKKRRDPGKGKCHAKTMMSTKVNERLR
jgi:hypothetical protein